MADAVVFGKDWYIFCTFCGIFTLLFLFKTEPILFIHYALQVVVLFGVLTFVLHWLDRKRVFSRLRRKQELNENSCTSLTQEELCQRQRSARDALQERYSRQSTEYIERVLKPRKEAKQRAAEEELYRFSGPAWKGRGDRLGPDDGLSTYPANRRSGRDAAIARHLPENVTNAPQPPKNEPRKRKVITIPPEPSLDDPEHITVSLRTPLGRIHRRRFLKSDEMQVKQRLQRPVDFNDLDVISIPQQSNQAMTWAKYYWRNISRKELEITLLNYMNLLGYSQQRYCISTSYPRCVISTDRSQTLAEARLLHDTCLNVEEVEQETE